MGVGWGGGGYVGFGGLVQIPKATKIYADRGKIFLYYLVQEP
jgi:hypothetical protein